MTFEIGKGPMNLVASLWSLARLEDQMWKADLLGYLVLRNWDAVMVGGPLLSQAGAEESSTDLPPG